MSTTNRLYRATVRKMQTFTYADFDVCIESDDGRHSDGWWDGDVYGCRYCGAGADDDAIAILERT